MPHGPVPCVTWYVGGLTTMRELKLDKRKR